MYSSSSPSLYGARIHRIIEPGVGGVGGCKCGMANIWGVGGCQVKATGRDAVDKDFGPFDPGPDLCDLVFCSQAEGSVEQCHDLQHGGFQVEG